MRDRWAVRCFCGGTRCLGVVRIVADHRVAQVMTDLGRHSHHTQATRLPRN